MPLLTIFRESFTNSLRANVPSNLSKYGRDDCWVTEIGTRSSREIETRVELNSSLALDGPEGGDLRDLENAMRLHRALRHLTPLQARDPRLWTRIAHVEAWSYMRKRWPIERFAGDSDKGARFILSRYFVAQSEGRALLRNGIARLWWTAQLSYDDARDNPYELTGVLLSTLDITQQILERNMGRARIVVAGFLEFLLRKRATLLARGEQNRARIRRLAKFLNMYGGVCLLDCLTQTDIIRLLEGELDRALAGEVERRSEDAQPDADEEQ
ncbi:MAG: DUF6339 family protein [Terriglobia bacterium]